MTIENGFQQRLVQSKQFDVQVEAIQSTIYIMMIMLLLYGIDNYSII